MIGSFGDITFEVPLAPETAEHSRGAEYSAHEVVGGTPVKERVGDEADEVSFSIRLRRRWMDTVVNVERELETLRAKVDADEPEQLVLGPEPFGRFVLTRVDTTYVRMSGERVEAADVDLTFEEYN